MNAIQLLATQPWVERLGATLLHFLWQGIAIAFVYALVRHWMARDSSPHVRYLLACGALATMAAAPVFTWSLLGPAATTHVALQSVSPVAAAPVRHIAATTPTIEYSAASPTLLPWVVAIWFVGTVALWMRLLGGWILAERLRSRLVRPAPHDWQQALDRLRHRIRISRPVRLLVSSMVQAPAVIGCLRPVVLVPIGVLAGLPADQVEALLLHELAHIRRHDYFVNVLQSVVEALLFYHPAVWWISSHMRAERELCCDDVAVSVSGDAISYARALATLASESPTVMMAANGGSLAHRIARLLGQSRSDSRMPAGSGMVASALLIAVTALALFGQTAPRPKFDVTSIKLSDSRGLRNIRILPDRLIADGPVGLLVQNAYSVQAFQIVGAPQWTDDGRYAVEAKVTGGASRARMALMLQSLLEDRFQLKIHHETRELPVYSLVAAKSGIRLPPPRENGCEPLTVDAPPEWAGGRMLPPGRGPAAVARCGSVGVSLELSGARMQGGKVSMPELIRALSLVLDRPVIDRTGFPGLFDVRLDFQPDETTPSMPAPPPDPSGAPPVSGTASLFKALQEQLGLRLESGRGPVDVIVIDHIAAPSAN